MTKTTVILALVFAIAALTCAVVVLAVREPAEVGTWRRKAVALDKYCEQKRMLLEFHRKELVEPRNQPAIFELLQMEIPFWDLQEVWMCVGYDMKLENRSDCIHDRDVECVTKMWKEIETAIANPKY